VGKAKRAHVLLFAICASAWARRYAPLPTLQTDAKIVGVVKTPPHSCHDAEPIFIEFFVIAYFCDRSFPVIAATAGAALRINQRMSKKASVVKGVNPNVP
jgi:hypothetical protein